MPRTLPALLRAVARAEPDRLCCVLPGPSGRRLSFAELETASRRVAGLPAR